MLVYGWLAETSNQKEAHQSAYDNRAYRNI